MISASGIPLYTTMLYTAWLASLMVMAALAVYGLHAALLA